MFKNLKNKLFIGADDYFMRIDDHFISMEDYLWVVCEDL